MTLLVSTTNTAPSKIKLICVSTRLKGWGSHELALEIKKERKKERRKEEWHKSWNFYVLPTSTMVNYVHLYHSWSSHVVVCFSIQDTNISTNIDEECWTGMNVIQAWPAWSSPVASAANGDVWNHFLSSGFLESHQQWNKHGLHHMLQRYLSD